MLHVIKRPDSPSPLALYDAHEEAYEMRKSFKLFARSAWDAIEPGTPLLWNWHLDVICDHLQAVYERRIKRLAITLAPGHAKSSFISQLFPDWCWLNNPYLRFLCAAHSLDLAIRDNKYRRDLIESEWFQERYGNIFTLSSSQNVKSFFQNDHRGYMMATAVRSSGTGKRADISLIDDPNNAMAGKADILAVKEWFGKTWMSRLNDQENGPMIVVGQRLDEEDLIGHILKLGWEHLSLPEEYEPARESKTSLTDIYPDGKYDKRTKEGELLWPEKFSREVLAKLKKSLGSMNYAAQYQQSPVPAAGGQFKRQWFHYFEQQGDYYILHGDTIKSVARKACKLFATVDPAISSKQEADYTVIQVWAHTPDNELLLIAQVRDHLDNPDQQKAIYQLYDRFHFLYVAVETVAYQLALFQQLRKGRKTADGSIHGIPVKEYKPTRDKVARASVAAIMMEAGDIYFEQDADYLPELESEVLKFPKDAHDDQVDDMSMACDLVTMPIGGGILLPKAKEKVPAPALSSWEEQVGRVEWY